MSTLVTLGCSFSQGDGAYDFSLGDSVNDFINFRENNMENFLKNSIGSNIQERFGYQKYINYAYAGSSNESQMLLFFNQLPKDDDVTVLWQITFYHRKFQLVNKGVHDGGLHYKWVVDSMAEKIEKHQMTDWDVEQDMRFETLLRINLMNEYCKAKGWKFFTWTWMSHEYKWLVEMYPKIKEVIIPYKNPFDVEMDGLPKEWVSKIPNDSHPNEVGYKVISDGLCDCIIENNFDFPKPNETPMEKVKINPEFITL